LYLWGRKVEAQLMRTLVWGLNLASGDRERGKAAGCEGDGTDERGPLVSVHVRGRVARAARVQAERAWAGLRAKFQAARCAKIFFFFFLCNFC
jgi:hypothetical protein